MGWTIGVRFRTDAEMGSTTGVRFRAGAETFS